MLGDRPIISMGHLPVRNDHGDLSKEVLAAAQGYPFALRAALMSSK